jgi:ABC-type uncharacterized transport system involved in gliding motility auxiliary subunit
MAEVEAALSSRYDVQAVTLEPDSLGSVPPLSPDTIDVIALVGPTSPVAPETLEALETYLDQGGAALLFVENSQLSPQAPISQPLDAGLGPLLESRGVRLTDQMAYDLRSNQNVSLGQRSIFNLIAPYPLWPVAVPSEDHPTNRNLEMLSLAWAAVLEITDSTRAVPLWSTTESGGRKPASGSIDPETAVNQDTVDPSTLAPQVLAAAVRPAPGAPEAGSGGRLVVVGDADLLQSQFLRGSPQNLTFLANAVDWLAQDESLIEIRSKDRTPPPLVFESDFERSALRWGNTAGVPLAFILLGLLRARSRRNGAAELWRKVRTSGREEDP